MNKHKGMTLTEVLIALGVVGVLAAISIPQINKVKPNQEMIKFKKAFSITQRIVSELVHDDDLYPDIKGEPYNSGLSNIDFVAEVHGVRYNGDEKFCKLFASRMQVVGKVDCSHTSYEKEDVDNYGDNSGTQENYTKVTFDPSFTTVDGVQWCLPMTDFSAGSEDSAQEIAIDVNGNSGYNCFASDYSYNSSVDTETQYCKNPDRFIIKVNRSGDVWVDGDVEKKYLESNKTTKSYKQILKEIEEGKGNE